MAAEEFDIMQEKAKKSNFLLFGPQQPSDPEMMEDFKVFFQKHRQLHN